MMEFIDLYMVLEVSPNATEGEILISYRRLCKIWHPDKNPGMDTTYKMQEIVAARLILTDFEARRRYDVEYLRVKSATEKTNQDIAGNKHTSDELHETSSVYTDPELEKWIRNAQKQSGDITSRLISELREQFGIGLAGSFRGIKNFFLGRKLFD